MTPAGGDREITLNSVVVATKEQVSSDLSGETVVLSMTSARYFGLAGVAARIWELVTEPARVSEICGTIAEEFEVAPERCEADVRRFLGELVAKGLIEVRVGA